MRLNSKLFFLGGILLLSACVTKRNSEQKNKNDMNSIKNETNYYRLDEGNQYTLNYCVEMSKENLDSLQADYSWDEFDVYDNLLFAYMEELFDAAIEKYDYKDYKELWIKSTRIQKVFWSFLAFGGDTDNGGVYKFMFYRTEHIYSILEVWNELGIEKLIRDYKSLLIEYEGVKSQIIELKELHDSDKISHKKRTQAYSDGRPLLTKTELIENYFYDEEFKKMLYKKMVDYIDSNIQHMVKIVD